MCLWYNQKPMKVAKHWRAIVCSIPSSSSFSFILTVSLSFFFPLGFRKQSFYKNENLASRELQVYLQLCYRSFDIIAYFPVPLELSGKNANNTKYKPYPCFLYPSTTCTHTETNRFHRSNGSLPPSHRVNWILKGSLKYQHFMKRWMWSFVRTMLPLLGTLDKWKPL